MTTADIKRYGMIKALEIEAKGMEFENKQREIVGESMAYNASAFADIAREMQEIVHKHDYQL